MNKKRITGLLGACSIVAGLLMPQAAMAATRAPEETRRTTVSVPDTRPSSGLSISDRIINCPADTHPVPFDMPVYDEDGLFVVGHYTVWFCIPDDYEPQG